MSMLVLLAPYPSPEPTADTTRIKADNTRVITNASSGIRAYFVALNTDLHIELERRGLA